MAVIGGIPAAPRGMLYSIMRALLFLSFAAMAPLHAAWQAGAAAVDISPSEPVWLAGYAARTRPSESVREPIHVKALALRDDAGALAAIVTFDLVGVRREMIEPVAERAARELHIPRERILFNASHTHSAPLASDPGVYASALGTYLDSQTAALARYREKLPGLVYQAIANAVATLQPATLVFEQGYAGIAVNRRRVGHREYPGPVDQDVPVLTARAADGHPIAILFGYACHNTVMDDYTVHGDYAGSAQRQIESRFPGAVALFVQGAGADSNPLPRHSNELRERYGAVLADAVAEVIGRKMKPLAGPLRAAIAFPEAAFEGPFDRDRWQTEAASKDARLAEHGRRMLRILASGESIPQSRALPVEAWRFGDGMMLIAIGCETTVDYALKFKARYGPDTTWIAGYSNDTFGYLPSLRVWKEGGYEGGEAFRFSNFPGRFTSDIEDRVTAAVESVVARVR